jgi:hypothetical protein
MPRKRREAKQRRGGMPPEVRAILLGEDKPAGLHSFDWYLATNPRRWWVSGTHPSHQEWWWSCRDSLLPEWIAARPGTRPDGWWCFDAPRWEDEGYTGPLRERLPAPRRILIDGEVLAPEHFGICVHPIFCGFVLDEEGLGADAVETQRSYLARHGLLTQAEALALRGVPDPGFEPLPDLPSYRRPHSEPDPRRVLVPPGARHPYTGQTFNLNYAEDFE